MGAEPGKLPGSVVLAEESDSASLSESGRPGVGRSGIPREQHAAAVGFRAGANLGRKRRIVIALLQRVSRAEVTVDGHRQAAVDTGLLVLVGVERGDGPAQAARLAERLTAYRVFPDAQGRMNLSVRDVGGGILLVPQFTLAADTRQGNRPGFSTAEQPQRGRELFEEFVNQVRARHEGVETGVFGAHMLVCLCNDGPVTFWLQAPPER